MGVFIRHKLNFYFLPAFRYWAYHGTSSRIIQPLLIDRMGLWFWTTRLTDNLACNMEKISDHMGISPSIQLQLHHVWERWVDLAVPASWIHSSIHLYCPYDLDQDDDLFSSFINIETANTKVVQQVQMSSMCVCCA